MNYPDTIEFEITQEDTDKCEGFVSNTNCLLATAIKRLGYKNLIVYPISVSFEDEAGICYNIEGGFSSLEPNFYRNYPHGFIGRKFVLTLIK